jgi:hypothetical protein
MHQRVRRSALSAQSCKEQSSRRPVGWNVLIIYFIAAILVFALVLSHSHNQSRPQTQLNCNHTHGSGLGLNCNHTFIAKVMGRVSSRAVVCKEQSIGCYSQ